MKKIHIAFILVLIFVSLSVILFANNFQPEISETGHFLVITGGSFGLITGLISLLLLIQVFSQKQITRVEEKKEPRYDEALEQCKQMLYVIEQIDTKNMKYDKKVKLVLKGVFHPLQRLMTQYKEFVHGLPKNYRDALYDVYKSLTGREGHHYGEGRKSDDVKHLKEILLGIISTPYKPSQKI